MSVVDFCPATRAANDLSRIEAAADLIDRSILRQCGHADRSDPEVLKSLECIQLKLSLESEASRDELASVPAKSAAGAIAQLLAAIRDMRVNDDDHRRRAAQLEMTALEYLRSSGVLDPRDGRRISRTKAVRTVQPASRAISSSEMS